MLVLWAALSVRHPNTAQCAKGAERKRFRLVVKDMRESTEKTFHAYGLPLTLVSSFE